jgi:hypothetical protein
MRIFGHLVPFFALFGSVFGALAAMDGRNGGNGASVAVKRANSANMGSQFIGEYRERDDDA